LMNAWTRGAQSAVMPPCASRCGKVGIVQNQKEG
jgi:hypothetical protein